MDRHWHFINKSWQLKLIERGWRSDPFTAAIIGTAIVGYGVYSGVSAIAGGGGGGDSGGGQAPAPAPLPVAPTPEASITDARSQAVERRKTILATGGQTNPTGAGGAILNPTQTSGKTLLGS